MPRARASNDILDYVPGIFKRVASTHGGEWAGPCPWCYGTDRFRVWPYREAGENVYWCRGCGACGDLIQFLRDYQGLSFLEACRVSGQEPRGGKGKRYVDLLKTRRVSSPLEPEQLSLLETFQVLSLQMRAALGHPRAQAYLTYRCIPLAVAKDYEMGYLPPITQQNQAAYERQKLLRLWADSLVTPTFTPEGGIGYTARTLKLWEPGMDEETHKALLQAAHLPRMLKTGNAGWLWRSPEVGRQVMLVEGKFEVLALVAAGLDPTAVIGVMTNSANVDWLPLQVRAVLVAFNGDARGQAGAQRLLQELRCAGLHGVNCVPPQDNLGTDCSARWRIAGPAGLVHLFEAWERLGTDGAGAGPQEVPSSSAAPLR